MDFFNHFFYSNKTLKRPSIFIIYGLVFLASSRMVNLNAESNQFDNFKNQKHHFNYAIKHSKKKKIASLVRKKTIDRTLKFTINVPADIFDDLFNDLTYAVAMSRKHAKTKFSAKYITNKGCYDSSDGIKTYADIYPLPHQAFDVNKIPALDQKNQGAMRRLYYFVEGSYKYVFTLKGNMLLYFSYQPLKSNSAATQFEIKAYILIQNLLLRGMVRNLLKNHSFKEFTNKLVDNTINRIVKIGRRVGYGILWDRAKNNKLPSKSRKIPTVKNSSIK